MSHDKNHPQQNVARTERQNDLFRQSLGQNPTIPGTVCLTESVAHSDEFKEAALLAVQNFSAFTEGNDPHGEHDFGAVNVNHEKLFWKIDLYDQDYKFGSEVRDDLAMTRRVLTIMHASEY